MVFNRILVPLDGSSVAEDALGHAARIARAYNSRIFLLQVLDHKQLPERDTDEIGWRLHRYQVQEYLNGIQKRLAGLGLASESHVAEGRAPGQILDFVRDRRIDLVVLSAYGAGGESEFRFGGTVQKVVSMPETSMMIIRPNHGIPDGAGRGYHRILVPVDGSQRAAWAVSLISGLAGGSDHPPEIVLLQVVKSPDMPRTCPLTREEEQIRDALVACNRQAATRYLQELSNRFADKLPVRTRLEVSPHVVDEIQRVAETESVDLVVLTAHGTSGSTERLSGTICQSVVSTIGCPVMILQDSPSRYHGMVTHIQDETWTEPQGRAG